MFVCGRFSLENAKPVFIDGRESSLQIAQRQSDPFHYFSEAGDACLMSPLIGSDSVKDWHPLNGYSPDTLPRDDGNGFNEIISSDHRDTLQRAPAIFINRINVKLDSVERIGEYNCRLNKVCSN